MELKTEDLQKCVWDVQDPLLVSSQDISSKFYNGHFDKMDIFANQFQNSFFIFSWFYKAKLQCISTSRIICVHKKVSFFLSLNF